MRTLRCVLVSAVLVIGTTVVRPANAATTNTVVCKPNIACNGTAANDKIIGTNGPDQILGDLGDDVIYGRGGRDDIDAGDGNDKVFGGDGADDLSGGQGNDTMGGGAGRDKLEGEGGNDVLIGGDQSDILAGGSLDNIAASGIDDVRFGPAFDYVVGPIDDSADVVAPNCEQDAQAVNGTVNAISATSITVDIGGPLITANITPRTINRDDPLAGSFVETIMATKRSAGTAALDAVMIEAD